MKIPFLYVAYAPDEPAAGGEVTATEPAAAPDVAAAPATEPAPAAGPWMKDAEAYFPDAAASAPNVLLWH